MIDITLTLLYHSRETTTLPTHLTDEDRLSGLFWETHLGTNIFQLHTSGITHKAAGGKERGRKLCLGKWPLPVFLPR